jgi:predicted outer membrane repeat protein
VFFALFLVGCSSAHALTCLGLPRQVYVGDTASDASCTYNDIQTALSNEGANCPVVVNITHEHTYTSQALTISGKKLTLRGWPGGVTCNLLANCNTVGCLPAETGSPLITLSGAAGNSVLHIDGSSGVSIQDIQISDGIVNPLQGGGGIFFGGTGSLTLGNSTISNNQAGYGAGIAMSPSGPATLTLGANTVIEYNDATVNGGGILVEGETTLTATSPNTWIQGNTALAGDGGGIIVNAPAVANIGSPGFFGLPVIDNNSAAYGGGIAVEGSQNPPSDGLLRLYTTDPNNPVSVSGNSASHTGGGIFVKPVYSNTQNLTFLCAYDFRIDDNFAQEGAAIYSDLNGVGGGGDVYLNLDPVDDTDNVCQKASAPGIVACAAGVACNEINGNIAQTTDNTPTDGAAILIQSAGTLFGYRFSMRENQGGELIRFLTDEDYDDLDTVGGNTLRDCLFANNTTTGNLIEAAPGGGADNVVKMDSCTIADNQIGAPYVMLTQISNSSHFALTNLIIDQPGRATVDYDGPLDNFTVEYLLSNDTSTISSGTGVRAGAPTFVDAANGDYHLQRTSLGVNYAPPGTDAFDLDGHTRVVNLPGVTDVFGPMDLGAYEVQAACMLTNDTLFCDGFEGNP